MNETQSSKILVDLNEDALNQAITLIQDPTLENVELKKLLLDLVQDIVNLKEVASSVVKKETKKREVNAASYDNVYRSSGLRVKAIKDVQDIISTKYSDIIGKGTSAVEYKAVLRNIVTVSGIKIPGAETVTEVVDELYKELQGASVIDDFINQPDDIEFEEFIEEIRIDDFNDIRIVRNGRPERTQVSFESPEHLDMFANTLANNNGGQNFSTKQPAVKLRVGKTTRVTMIRNPIAVRDKRLTMDEVVIQAVIRKQRSTPFTIEKLIQLGSISEFGANLLKCTTSSGVCTTFIGGTGTGKTSMMVPFLSEIKERTISMAEIDEMNFRRLDFDKEIVDENGKTRPNPNYLKAKNSAIMWETPDLTTEVINGLRGFEGMFNIGLTMTPSTFIIQETKGGEAASLQNAAISGHQTVTSVHCEDASLFPTRVVKMIQMTGTKVSEDILMKEIVEAFPLVVTCERLGDKTRKILAITELLDYIPETKEVLTNTLLRYEISHNEIDPSTGNIKTIGEHKVYNLPSPKMKRKMLRKGMLESDWSKLEVEYNSIVTTDKPQDLDKSVYEKIKERR